MKITHIGIWTKQLEVLRSFYTTYFQGKSHAKYVNPKKGFESYMLRRRMYIGNHVPDRCRPGTE